MCYIRNDMCYIRNYYTGVKPVMRQAINLEKKISAALQKHFPESLQRAFDEMDKNHDRYIDKEDLKEGIKKVLKITNVEDSEMAALIEKLNLEGDEKGLDFSAFLVRFGAYIYIYCIYYYMHCILYIYVCIIYVYMRIIYIYVLYEENEKRLDFSVFLVCFGAYIFILYLSIHPSMFLLCLE